MITFAGWLVIVTIASLLGAVAAAAHQLNVDVSPDDAVAHITGVAINQPGTPAVIDCDFDGTTSGGACSAEVGNGLPWRIEITVEPAPGFTFSDWTRESTDPLFNFFLANPCDTGSVANPCFAQFNSAAATQTATITANVNELLPPPDVTLEAPTGIGTREATFHGTVNPNGNATTWRFEYRAVGSSTWKRVPDPDQGAGAGNDPVAVEASLDDLEPSTEYEVRLHAANATTSATSDVETFTTEAVPAVVSTGRAWSISDGSATLSATVDPKNSPIADCHFEYGTTTEYGQRAPCSPSESDIDQPNEVQQLTVRVTDVTEPSNRNFRLTFEGQTTSQIPADASASVVEARLQALSTIGPGNVSVTGGPGDATGSNPYLITFVGDLARKDVEELVAENSFVRWDEDAHTSIETIAPGGFPVRVTAEITDLESQTTYHFRVVADNGVGGEQRGGDADFTTRPTIDFPRRGFELVSAEDANGIDVVPDFASIDGDRFAYATVVLPIPGAENGGQSRFIASRRPDGSWTQSFVGAPVPQHGPALENTPPFYAPDLSWAVWSVRSAVDVDDENGVMDVYRRSADTGATTWLSRDPAIPPGTPQTDPVDCGRPHTGPQYVGVGGSRIIFACERNLLPADTSSSSVPSLYEWKDGELSLVGIAPGSDQGLPGGSMLGSIANRRGFGGENVYGNDVARNAVSRDGSRVFFQSGANLNTQRLYVRIDAEDTVEASASGPGAPPTAGPFSVNYWGADVDGEVVFFTSSSPLTADSVAPDSPINPSQGTGGRADLYRYSVPDDGDPANGELIDLTPHPGGAGVRQVLWVSDDGRRVYFLAEAALTPNAEKAEQCHELVDEVPGPCNLYLVEFDGPADESPELTLVASGRIPLGTGSSPSAREQTRSVGANPDGSVLAFRSPDALVPGRRTGGQAQVYAYDAERGELSCASCPTDGSSPAYRAGLTPELPNGYEIGHNFEINDALGYVRNVSTERSVFFHTKSALSERDANGKLDVYEWRGGRLELISGGGQGQTYFAGASTDGSTLFLASQSVLAPGAEGGVYKIYAARVGGGFTPQAPTPPCEGDDCRGDVPSPPLAGQSGSSEFHGRGNRTEGSESDDCRRLERKARRATKRSLKANRRARRLARKQARARGGKSARLGQRAGRAARRARQAERKANRATKQARQCRRGAK